MCNLVSTPTVIAFTVSERARRSDDDSMDVDEESGDDAGGDTEEDEPEMSVDEDEGSEATPKKPKKASKLKPRKSQLNVEALTQERAILATYDEHEITTLRLQKKYYSDALNFIGEIEAAMDPMCKLLGSTSKPEVLEVMEFFRVAHEYEFESAKVRLFSFFHQTLVFHVCS